MQENTKIIILNNQKDNSIKAVLNLKEGKNSFVKIFNFQAKSKKLALGIKQKDEIIKIPLNFQNNNCDFLLPKSINLKENFLCAMVDVSNAFCPEIVLSGSANNFLQNSKIENAFTQTKPQDLSVLYEEFDDDKIESLVDKNLEEDLNSVYYDACSLCRYRKAFYEEGKKCCCINETNEEKNDKKNIETEVSFQTIKETGEEENAIFNQEKSLLDDNLDLGVKESEKRKNVENEPILSFYEQVKTQIDALFEKYPKEEMLENLISNSKWVRVNFNGKEEFYVLGLIYDDENKKVEYISYGMPSNDNKNPPEDLKDFAQWLPIDFNKPEADGFWLVYQEAFSGETIKVNLI